MLEFFLVYVVHLLYYMNVQLLLFHNNNVRLKCVHLKLFHTNRIQVTPICLNSFAKTQAKE